MEQIFLGSLPEVVKLGTIAILLFIIILLGFINVYIARAFLTIIKDKDEKIFKAIELNGEQNRLIQEQNLAIRAIGQDVVRLIDHFVTKMK